MTTTYNAWLNENTALPGVLASGVRYPDKSVHTRTFKPGFNPAALDHAWQLMAEAYNQLKQQKLPAMRLRWVFEHAVIQCVMRSDGICLCVVTAPDAAGPKPELLNRVFADFQMMWA